MQAYKVFQNPRTLTYLQWHAETCNLLAADPYSKFACDFYIWAFCVVDNPTDCDQTYYSEWKNNFKNLKTNLVNSGTRGLVFSIDFVNVKTKIFYHYEAVNLSF